MKKTALLFAGILLFLLTACVPERQEGILDIGPDEDGRAGTPVDFEILASDTMDGIEDMEPYSFVTRVRITGENTGDGGTVNVVVGTMDEVLREDADAFAAAVMRSRAASAGIELLEYHAPEKDSFGDFWDKYSVTIEFFIDDGSETEEVQPYYVYEHKAGEPITLDPHVEDYSKDYYRRKAILERNV